MSLEFKINGEYEVPDIDSFLEEFVQELVSTVKMRTPVLSGTLQSSVSSEKQGDGFALGTDVDYGSYVEFGTSKRPAQNMFRSTIEEADLIANRIKVKNKG
jgi:hypothetical protein